MTEEVRQPPEDWSKRVGPLALSLVVTVGAMAVTHILLKQWLPHKAEQAITMFVMMAVSSASTHFVFSGNTPFSRTRRILTAVTVGVLLSGFGSLVSWVLAR